MMTIDEGKKAIEELKAQGNSEEEIAGSMYLMFKNGEITVEELESLIGLMGFELTDEFKNMDPESQKEKGYELINEDSEMKGETKSQQEQENPKDDGDNNEEKEEKQAMGLFNKKDAPEEEESDEEKEAMKLLKL